MSAWRWLGYILAVGLLFWAGMGGCHSRQAAFVAPGPDRIAELGKMPPAGYRQWLAANAKLAGTSVPYQVLIIRKTPDADPLVLGGLSGEEGEETSGWRAPWPVVREALEQPLAAPATVSKPFLGMKYHHHLVPVNSQAGINLLINHWQEKPPG